MAEMAWVRRLARALVRDDALADDVAQDTWLIAHDQQPAMDRPLRPWLARVVLNLVRTRRRADVRRDVRELAGDVSRPVPTPDELVERVELQRAVAEEVLALAEPYRSTVLLHFFEGLSSAELAARLGIPAGTVRRRLKVALDQLREALRRRANPPAHGWLAALAPFAKAPVVTPTLGVVVMKKLVAIVALILLALTAGFVWKRHRDAAREAPSTGTVASPGPRLAPRDGAAHVIPSWLVQAGVSPRRIAGRVVAGAAPVSGATVKLALHLDGAVLQPLAEATTSSDGAFDFGAQPAATFSVSAAAPEHAPVAITVALADPHLVADHLVLELGDCRARLIGLVTDAGGGPIANAHVSSAGLGGVVSDPSGHYSACLAPLGEPGTAVALVRVEADGYGAVQERVIVVGELHHDFVLAPEAVLVGRVTAGERAVAGARVIATLAPGEGGRAVGNGAETDADGRFRIAGLAPAKFLLSASADHLGTAVPVLAVARPAATSHDIHLVLVALARVSGRVVMAGAPVAGAAVAIAMHGDPLPGGSISQADGSFVLDRVPFGTATLVAPPFQVVAPTTLAVTRNLDGIDLEVGKLASVRGRVTRNGKPVARGGVMCATGTPPAHETTADSDGVFALEGLPGGMLVCSAWDPVDRAFALPPPIQIAAAEDKHVDFDVDNAGAVQGTVVDEAGQAVPRAYVHISIVNGGNDSCDAISDDRGAFDCRSLTGGEYGASVAPSPGSRQTFAPASGHFASIEVPKQGVITGIVLAIKNDRAVISGNVVDDTGAAIPDVTIRAIGRGFGGMGVPSVLSDEEGRFEIRDLAPGTYNLDARSADGGETEVVGIASATTNVTIKLPRPGAVDGTLVGFSNVPLVTASTTTADLHFGTIAIVDGTTFAATGLTPGHYVIEAQAGAEVDGATVDVRSGETAHVTLTSRGRAAIDGRVTELDTQAPLAGMRCDANLSIGGQMSGVPPDPSRQAFSDAKGHFHVDAPAGHVRVFCFFPMGGARSPAGTDLDTTPNAVASVELISVRATYGVTPGNPGFTVLWLALPVTVGQVDAKGPAAAAGLRPGDHLVTIDGASLQGMLPQGANTLLQNHHPGTIVVLGIERAGVTSTISISVGG